MKKTLKVITEPQSGLNTEFVNPNSNRKTSLEQAIEQVEKKNPTYSGYHVVEQSEGTKYLRSNPDKSAKNNIE